MYCTVHNRYGTSLDHSRPLSHPLHHTTTMWKLPPAPSFHEIPSRGLFCDKEVMRNTSGTAPVFPNVELKSADSMFLALILYLSWQEKMDQWNGLVLWPPRTLMIRKKIQPSVSTMNMIVFVLPSHHWEIFHRIGINTTVMGTRDVYVTLVTTDWWLLSVHIRWRIICYVRPISDDKWLNVVPSTTSILVIFYFLSHSATLSK